MRESVAELVTIDATDASHLTGEMGVTDHYSTSTSCPYMMSVPSNQVNSAVSGLDSWFETMRGNEGYGGPVAHWWQQSLMYTGPGLDWRYEGIIDGYLKLWRQTSNSVWRDKALRAADDLVAGQLSNGHFRASAFEINPSIGGTPHEAACDVGLLLVAQNLRNDGDDRWIRYVGCARKNLESYYVDRLWDPESRCIGDSTTSRAFVPNKAATATEAMFLLSEITGDVSWAERYAIPTLERIIKHQVIEQGKLNGAIIQNSFDNSMVEKYFPIYIARCVPALVYGYEWTGSAHYLDAALRALEFIKRWTYEDGSLPAVVYSNRRVNDYPAWFAALGDILRAAELLIPHGFDRDFSATAARLLDGQDDTGGIQTASGFAGQVSGRIPELPDIRDLLHVVGWCDKAFRYLSGHVTPGLVAGSGSKSFESPCTFQGKELQFLETPELLQISVGGQARYRWRKGQRSPDLATEEFWLR